MDKTTYFLTRKQYDSIVGTADLMAAFEQCHSRKWSLAGVEFVGLPSDLRDRIASAVGAA